jgi:hypothetical protein
LLDRGHTPVILDVRAPRDLKQGAVFIEGSILDPPKLTEIFRDCDSIAGLPVMTLSARVKRHFALAVSRCGCGS